MAIYGKSKCETAKHKNSETASAETGSHGIMMGQIGGILFNGPVKQFHSETANAETGSLTMMGKISGILWAGH